MKRRAAAALAVIGLCGTAHAASWTMIEGTEPPNVTHRLFGALQVNYENHFGCERLEGLMGPAAANNGAWVNNCRVGPELRNDNDGFFLSNLVLGARGNLVPTRINYFLAANAGQNLANYQAFRTERAHDITLTDASLTFSYIPGARVRVGRFKKPGPEEVYQGLDATDYVFLTDFAQRVQIERMIEGNAKNTAAIPGQGFGSQPGGTGTPTGNIKEYADDADVGRDTGVQLFDAFKRGSWTHAYAVMFAKGEGIHGFDVADDKYDRNLYWSSEYDLPGGKGPLKHGVKLYAYHQDGVRQFIIDPAGTKSEEFDKIRYGIGFKAIGHLFGEERGKHRLAAELMYAEGMIHYTPTANAAEAPFGGLVQIAAERENKARGTTVDYGYYLNKHWQFDLRYSRNNLLYEQVGTVYWNSADERVLEYWTLGFNYHFTPSTRLTFDYEFRDVSAPNPATMGTPAQNAQTTNNANVVTGSVGDRIGLRLTHKF